MPSNIFEPLKFEQLVAYVQGESILMSDKKKSQTGKAAMKRRTKLNEARQDLIRRLKTMNRFDPQFFPLKSHVEFHNWQDNTTAKGIVRSHTPSKVVVGFDGRVSNEEIDPKYLKLLYVRIKY